MVNSICWKTQLISENSFLCELSLETQWHEGGINSKGQLDRGLEKTTFLCTYCPSPWEKQKTVNYPIVM